MKHNVKCKSGLTGWQGKLHEVYHNLEDFRGYCNIYNIQLRLGFMTVEGCWKSNPTVQGSVNPSDLRRVYKNGFQPGRKPSSVKRIHSCKKCGTPLNSKGRCEDITCPYNNAPQYAELDALYEPKWVRNQFERI